MASGVDGNVALVTGMGRGFGWAIALALAEAGVKVDLTAHSEDRIQTVAAEIQARQCQALRLPDDITSPGVADRPVAVVSEPYGQTDILVNAAGISPVDMWAERLGLSD